MDVRDRIRAQRQLAEDVLAKTDALAQGDGRIDDDRDSVAAMALHSMRQAAFALLGCDVWFGEPA